MSDIVDPPDQIKNTSREPLTKRSYEATKIQTREFSTDRIVWKSGEPTLFPDSLRSDSFSNALIRYYNSPYFNTEVNAPSYIKQFKEAIEYYIKVMESDNLTETPEYIFQIYDTYLREENLGYRKEYKLYSCFRSLALKLSSTGWKSRRRKNRALFQSIAFTDEERIALLSAFKLSPQKKPPEKNEGESKPADLYEHLNMSGTDNAEDLIRSLRAFCAFFITEWGLIRNEIYENFSKEISPHLTRAKGWGNAIGFMSSPKVFPETKGYTGDSQEFTAHFCLKIAKKINHPFLTERFVTDYLNVFVNNDKRPEIAKTAWNLEELTSTSDDYDWLTIIEEQYTAQHKRSTGRICVPGYESPTRLLKPGHFPNLAPEYLGILGNTFPSKQILGLSYSEEVCASWLLATDRHQPSNLRWMTVSDISITDNSISTILDIHTLKNRARRTSGRSYDEFSLQESDCGETYKRNQTVFTAIKTYREQVIRAAAVGLQGKYNEKGQDDPYLFDGIRNNNTTRNSLQHRYAKFCRGNNLNIGILLCAMEGSASNQHTLHKCPQAKLFLKQIAKHYEPYPSFTKKKSSPNTNGSVNFIGVKTIGWNYIQKTAVSLRIAGRYSSTQITESLDNRAQVDDRKSDFLVNQDAALDNHGRNTRDTVYAQKLPAYLTERNDFAARVGDEWIRLAKELSDKKFSDSTVMSLYDIRKMLGFETTLEKEQEELNQLFGEIDQEEIFLDELGFLAKRDKKIIIVRHPIIIANIKSHIKAIDNHLDKLAYSNPHRVRKAVTKYMYLNLLLKEKFTASEIREADELYGDVDFPATDISL